LRGKKGEIPHQPRKGEKNVGRKEKEMWRIALTGNEGREGNRIFLLPSYERKGGKDMHDVPA